MAKREYTFRLVLDGIAEFDERTVSSLFEAGCDDATPVSSRGTAWLDFTREAETFRDAVLSAIRDVEDAGLVVARVEPDDVVGLAEIGERTGRNRETIRLYASGRRGPGGFPVAVHGNYFEWSKVAGWFREHGLAEVEAHPHADFIASVNAILELRKRVPTQSELLSLWKSLPKRHRPVSTGA